MDWRRSQIRRKKLDSADAHSTEVRGEVRDENQRVRAAAWTAFYQVKLLCGDSALENAAKDALEVTRLMKRALNLEALDAQGDAVRRQLDVFLDAASQQTMADTRRT